MHRCLVRALELQGLHPERSSSRVSNGGEGSDLRVLAWPSALIKPSGREGNPYPSLLYTGLSGRGIQIANFHWARLLLERWHIWHIHWPDGVIAGNRPSWVLLLRIALFWLLIRLSRLKRTRIVWTAHNLMPHESGHPGMERWFFGILTANLAAVICLSRSAKALLRQQYPAIRDIPVYVVPHGHYRGCYPDVISRQEARRKLGLGAEELVFLFIGQLRRYKNVIQLIECFRDGARQDWRLVIAGEPRDAALGGEVAALASACNQIVPILEFIPNDELQVYLRAGDVVVLPYKEILQLGRRDSRPVVRAAGPRPRARCSGRPARGHRSRLGHDVRGRAEARGPAQGCGLGARATTRAAAARAARLGADPGPDGGHLSRGRFDCSPASRTAR